MYYDDVNFNLSDIIDDVSENKHFVFNFKASPSSASYSITEYWIINQIHRKT